MALLNYRNTPLRNGWSPAELLMGRRLKTNIPVHPKTLIPKVPEEETLRRREVYSKSMAKDYDRRHRTKDQPELNLETKSTYQI